MQTVCIHFSLVEVDSSCNSGGIPIGIDLILLSGGTTSYRYRMAGKFLCL